ncbi:Wzz/FepE/Etk N-terminal domain-containing protein [Anoxynatronum buryatiense]|uniref:Chain length determinant protein n=1 Tax=Anoxynatronum buryatiense TaxID=489973 RepID=A0AA45WW21_9CLOT|nr:Wzz/FepE/Etk N-terminal domain-containing protein [Anoxynatronum buryatiense]SMP56658.1 Chain length determinant protein [Anoxynatronum buryatiense]
MSQEKQSQPQHSPIFNGSHSPNGYHNGYYEEETSLREIIEALLKHWKKIVAITLAALVLTAAITLGFVTSVDEARVIISMSRPDRYTTEEHLQEIIANRLSLVSFNERNEMNIRDAQMLINSPEVVEAAMIQQGFVARPINRLMETIEINALNAYLFQINLQGTEKEALLGLVDEMAVQFNRITVEEITRSLNQEISRKKRAIQTAEMNLASNRAQMEATDPYITLERAVLDDPSMAVADPDANRTTVVRTQETNPSYLARLEAVTQAEMELNQLKVALDELKNEADLIIEQLNQLETAPVHIVRGATDYAGGNPLRRISPRISLNLAIALAIGLMMGAFMAFFIEYWQKSKPKQL